MKVARAVRQVFEGDAQLYARVEAKVTPILNSIATANDWLLVKRQKELASFALKAETGRVADLRLMEDRFGVTLVVQNLARTRDAERMILEEFDLVQRRPPRDDRTHKRPSDFVFDDLRLYVSKKQKIGEADDPIFAVPFEIQIKTFLQHAWSIATHDMVYKSDDVSWSKERISFQIKAMLEHAELAISEAEELAKSPSVSRNTRHTLQEAAIVATLKAIWDEQDLPHDLRRLAGNVAQVLAITEYTEEDLREIVDREISRVGILQKNLSPYSFIVQALLFDRAIDFRDCLSRRENRTSILVNTDMEFPAWCTKHPKVVFVQ
jgi:ppGpp synthetase/RelA/SpoT-type nucleotidyltranferase